MNNLLPNAISIEDPPLRVVDTLVVVRVILCTIKKNISKRRKTASCTIVKPVIKLPFLSFDSQRSFYFFCFAREASQFCHLLFFLGRL